MICKITHLNRLPTILSHVTKKNSQFPNTTVHLCYINTMPKLFMTKQVLTLQHGIYYKY